MRPNRLTPIVMIAVAILGTLVTSSAGGAVSAGATVAFHGSYVYWDQNEEQDMLAVHTGQKSQLIPPYNPNGQMCIFPDGSGRFVTGYNPTTDPTNPGFYKTQMQPPIGDAVWDPHGHFTGKTIYVPGPYALPGQTVGGDTPPDSTGNFNNNGTMTGCVFDPSGNLFADDLGTAQGQFPSPDNGRLIEWFAPSYTSYCVVDGPTSGGVGPHHVDGTGGLRQPGQLAVTKHGDVMVTNGGAVQGGLPAGQVLELAHDSLPHQAADCGPDGLYPAGKLHTSVFFQGSLSMLPFPEGIAFDRVCSCWAIASPIGDPSIAFFSRTGQKLSTPGAVPGENLSQIGMDPNGYNPFGLAFADNGTAYFADIHLHCSAPLTDCGPQANGGRVMRVNFRADGRPRKATPIDSGINFPVSVTVCRPHDVGVCPTPVWGAGSTG